MVLNSEKHKERGSGYGFCWFEFVLQSGVSEMGLSGLQARILVLVLILLVLENIEWVLTELMMLYRCILGQGSAEKNKLELQLCWNHMEEDGLNLEKEINKSCCFQDHDAVGSGQIGWN